MNKKLNLKLIFKQQLKENLLLLFTVLAVLAGIIIGLSLRSLALDKITKSYFNFPG